MWAGRVTRSDVGAAVWVQVPVILEDAEVGPCQWLGDQPAAGDRVLVGEVAGDRDEYVVLGVLSP